MRLRRRQEERRAEPCVEVTTPKPFLFFQNWDSAKHQLVSTETADYLFENALDWDYEPIIVRYIQDASQCNHVCQIVLQRRRGLKRERIFFSGIIYSGFTAWADHIVSLYDLDKTKSVELIIKPMNTRYDINTIN